MIKCGECGYENMDGLDYCDGCGAKLAAEAGEASGAQAEEGAESSVQPEAAVSAEGSGEQAEEAADDDHPEAAEAAAPEAVGEPAAEEEQAPSAESEAPTGEIGAEPAEEEAAPTEAPEAEAPAPAFKAHLLLVRGGRKGQEFPLEDGNNLIGRWDPETGSFPEVDLEQDDPEAKISRKHALLRVEGDKITIEDIGSLNGTYVNRQPRLQPGSPVELKAGDEVIIGKTFLKLVIDPVS